jgi:branched-chain amino acid transport system substrate-binding protein
MSKSNFTRRSVMKTGAAVGAGLSLPTILTAGSHAGYVNAPTGSSVTLGFNVPQSGPYADEGADELRAYKLAVEHLNGGGDGGMLNTFSSKALKGNGILGKKVEYVTGDTQTKPDAARASARSMIEKDGAVMITGGSSSGVAVAVQALCQEAGIIFMAGLTHSNDTTGKDKKANGFRHFFNSYMTGAALAPILADEYGKDRKAYHLTADYNWALNPVAAPSNVMNKWPNIWHRDVNRKRIGASVPSMKSLGFAKIVYYRCHTKANAPFMQYYQPCVTAMIGKSFAKVANSLV